MASLRAHIVSLKEEVARQQEMIQVLSDDKFFKPRVVERGLPPTESATPYRLTDYAFQTSTEDAGPEQEEESLDFNSEITKLGEQYAALKDGTK